MAVRNADGPVAAIAAVVGEDERDDAGEIALKRQHEQIAQQPQVLLIVGWDAERPRVLCRSDIDSRPCAVDTLFELAYAGEVFIELAAIVAAKRTLERNAKAASRTDAA